VNISSEIRKDGLLANMEGSHQGASVEVSGITSLSVSRIDDLSVKNRPREVARKAPATKNGFIIALLAAVALAFLFPAPGARGGWLHPDVLNNIGVVLILFLQGLSMAVERMKASAGNWRLHVIVQSFTFCLFPLVGLLFHEATRIVWPNEPSVVRDGFLYLCVLPSTVSTSVVLTSVAGGNTPAAFQCRPVQHSGRHTDTAPGAVADAREWSSRFIRTASA
jgi:hypothetical protein